MFPDGSKFYSKFLSFSHLKITKLELKGGEVAKTFQAYISFLYSLKILDWNKFKSNPLITKY